MLDVLAWICLENQQLLCTRTKGNAVFYLLGGKREAGESDWEALRREVYEELDIHLMEATLTPVVTVQAIAHGYADFVQVRMKCFQASYRGEIAPSSEIAEIAWLNYGDRSKCAPAAQLVLDHLHSLKWLG